MPATLDDVFDKVIDIESKTQTRVSILLTESPGQKDLYEVIDIRGIDGLNPSVIVRGLDNTHLLIVSSWIRKVEYNKLRTKNRDIKFILRVRGGLNGK